MFCWGGNHFRTLYFYAILLIVAKIWCGGIRFYWIWQKICMSAVYFSIQGRMSADLIWAISHYSASFCDMKSLTVVNVWHDSIIFYQIWSTYACLQLILWGWVSAGFMQVDDQPLWQMGGTWQLCYIANHGILSRIITWEACISTNDDRSNLHPILTTSVWLAFVENESFWAARHQITVFLIKIFWDVSFPQFCVIHCVFNYKNDFLTYCRGHE